MSRRFDPRTALLGGGLWSRVSQWGQRSLIKSVQYGTITTNGTGNPNSATATITAVNVASALVFPLGMTIASNGGSNQAEMIEPTLILTNATTVTSQTWSTYDGFGNVDVVAGFVVVEFVPGVVRSVQRGIITVAGAATSATATLAPGVNTAKTVLWSNGRYNTNQQLGNSPRVVLTNATTVTASRPFTATNTDSHIAWSVAEFF